MRSLLDANVLIAIGVPSHPAHRKVHDWMRREPDRKWATCALTQAAYLRQVCRYLGNTRDSFNRALAALTEDCNSPNHEFWFFEIDLRELATEMRSRIYGPNQITDLQLILLAHHHHGQLVTMDKGIVELARGTRYANTVHLL